MKSPKNKIWIVLLLVVFTVLFIQYDHRAPKRNFSDFHVPYVTAQRLINNEAIYTFQGNLSYYKYPVLYAFLMTPLTYLSEHNAARIWFLINLIFLCLVFYISRKIIEPHDDNYSAAYLYFIGSLLSFRFILENLHEGQANIFMLTMLLCGLYYILNKKETIGAFFLAFSIMLKYMPLLFLPYFLLKRKFSLVTKTALFIVLLTFLPVILVGPERIIALFKEQVSFLFVSSMDDYSIACYPNQSLLACISRFFYEKSWFSVKVLNLSKQNILTTFALSATALYILALVRKAKDRFAQVIDFSLIVICAVLFNPNAWKNFFVLIIFPYLAVVYYLMKIPKKDKRIFIMLVLSFMLNSLTSEFFVKSWAQDKFEVFSSVTFGTLILFFALVKMKFSPLPMERKDNV